jgi:hypothetical protein
MAGKRYPATLPVFLAAGHARQMGDSLDRVPMEVGPPRNYRILTGAPEFVVVGTLLSQAQFDVFYDFVENDITQGQDLFNTRVRGGDFNTGLDWWEARFAEPYKWGARTRGFYAVSARLRLVNGPYATEHV